MSANDGQTETEQRKVGPHTLALSLVGVFVASLLHGFASGAQAVVNCQSWYFSSQGGGEEGASKDERKGMNGLLTAR